jgi:hypothetical protein
VTEHGAVQVYEVAGDAQADDLAVAGTVLVAAGREAADQQMAVVEALAGPHDRFMAGKAGGRPARFPKKPLVGFAQRLPATQLGYKAVH